MGDLVPSQEEGEEEEKEDEDHRQKAEMETESVEGALNLKVEKELPAKPVPLEI